MSKGKKERRSAKERRNTWVGAGLTAAGLLLLFRNGIFFGKFNPLLLVLVTGAAYLVGKTVGVMSSGLDLTTHNREDRPPEFEDLDKTGNEHVDEVIAKGQDALRQIREANDEIKDPQLTEQLYTIEDKCTQIFRTISEAPDKVGQIRKFMNYYLPTTLKMLKSYRTMQNRGISDTELGRHRDTMRHGLDMINTACQKQLDNLYREDMLDISTDIDVLEQMLKRDGFVEGDLSAGSINQVVQEARTAAAASLTQSTPVREEDDHSVPTLVIPKSAGQSARRY
ncbi:MAG: 5-bromo-4-chloroindolyl phosphate hydrolysis family protein [Clostridia bacterium]|nr:5-bromo-4-chloroindolyl phosphate hydrolysis family protein [Clostridia bacterium]